MFKPPTTFAVTIIFSILEALFIPNNRARSIQGEILIQQTIIWKTCSLRSQWSRGEVKRLKLTFSDDFRDVWGYSLFKGMLGPDARLAGLVLKVPVTCKNASRCSIVQVPPHHCWGGT